MGRSKSEVLFEALERWPEFHGDFFFEWHDPPVQTVYAVHFGKAPDGDFLYSVKADSWDDLIPAIEKVLKRHPSGNRKRRG